jgi:uncharacterized protein (DUF1697 family)
MNIYVALFRGINVGGLNSLPMKELVTLMGDLGARNVKTYIQSGNAVFVSLEKDTARLANRISHEIKKRRGFEPHVMLLGLDDLERAMKNNPFPEAATDPRALHAGFLASAPQSPNLSTLERIKTPNERFQLIDKVFYLHAPDGIGRSKLAARVEKVLGVPMTDRNWRTVCKIWEMVQAIS